MEKIKIAVQKSGRLYEESLQLLRDCGISYNTGNEQLKIEAENFPLEIFLLRNSDIPQYLEDGVVDIAIVGDNLLYEKKRNIAVAEKLGFSKCRVSLAVPKDVDYQRIEWFRNKQIATSYPQTVRDFLDGHGIAAELHIISGSVEIAPNIGLADCICDIVSSGNTLFKNGLKEVHIIRNSEAVLAKNTRLSKEKESVLAQLLFRMRAVLAAKKCKYVLMNVEVENIDEILKILPVMKSPTVVPLAQTGWCSVHSVINEGRFWEVIDRLREAGAQDILIIPIDKMII